MWSVAAKAELTAAHMSDDFLYKYKSSPSIKEVVVIFRQPKTNNVIYHSSNIPGGGLTNQAK